MSSHPQRKSFFVDKKVQGALLASAARYWVLSLVTVIALSILGWMFITPGMAELVKLRDTIPSLVGGFMMAFLASLIVLPVILYDFAKLTNRFAGPMLRLRRCMQQSANGETVEPVRFRDGDYWHECAEAFNAMQKRIEMLERQVAEGETPLEEPEELVEAVV